MKLEKMQEIFQTVLADNINNCCGGNIEDIFNYLAGLGFSKKEAFDFIEENYLAGINWQSDDEDEEENELLNPTRECDYSQLITMLDKVNAQYKKLDKYIIELYQDAYNTVEFHFNKDFELVSVEW